MTELDDTWYFVKKPNYILPSCDPSGQCGVQYGDCVRQKLTESEKIKAKDQGSIVSTQNICGKKVPVHLFGVDFIPDLNPVTVTSSLEDLPTSYGAYLTSQKRWKYGKRSLSSLTGISIRIINDIDLGRITVPDSFHEKIKLLKEGIITTDEFESEYNYLIEKGMAYDSVSFNKNLISATSSPNENVDPINKAVNYLPYVLIGGALLLWGKNYNGVSNNRINNGWISNMGVN